MFNWKKLFKKGVNPQDIPVLEDVVDDVINDSKNDNEAAEDYPHLFSNEEESTREKDEFIIDLNDEIDIDKKSEDKNSEDENNVVILSSVIGETEVDIDDINIAGTDTIEMEAVETNIEDIDDSEDDADSNTVDIASENNTTEVNDAETDNNNTDDIDTEHNDEPNKTSDNHLDLSDPEQLEIIVDKVVEQLKPEIELQLHSFVKKALTETSAEDFLKSLNLDDDPTSDKS